MRYIPKPAEPAFFRAWKSRRSADWVPTYANLQKPEKPLLHRALIAEQGGLCCYCQSLVSADNSHIEHLLPRTLYPELQLDYANLLCSCGRPHGHTSMPDHCGHAKAEKELPITPLQQDCGTHFIYSSDGTIAPANSLDTPAAETIRILKLNSEELVAARKATIDTFIDDSGIDDWDSYARAFLADSPVPYISWLQALLPALDN